MRYLFLTVFALGFAPRLTAADVDFARDVLPILSDHCFACHGPDANARKGDLRLDTKEDALREESPVIVPGKSDASELIYRITTDDDSELMPPPQFKRKLTPQQIATLKQWVDQGATWGKHWAFEKPVRPTIPRSRDAKWSSWPRNPIDNFVLARLEREGLHPSPEADRRTLIRRVTLDLTGLPPTPQEVDAFLADQSPDAYEKVVGRLLASPRYGERMAWEWLEAARYADSNGYQGDDERTMWPWRDWVVRAFNEDMPFDQFSVEQLAGDLLPNATREQKLATGFLRNHMINGEGGRIPEENRIEYGFDMTETVGTVWMGLTFNCCRCHDHKYDPIAQKEYYSLFAFFNQTPVTGAGGNPQTPPVIEYATPEDNAKLKEARTQATATAEELGKFEQFLFPRNKDKQAADSEKASKLPKELRDALGRPPGRRSREQLAKLEQHFAATEKTYSEKLQELGKLVAARDEIDARIARVMVMEDIEKPRETFILTKGLYNQPADRVTAGVPAALPPLPEGVKRNRLALARWLVSGDHPLTARVVVNRYWQMFFGTGLVKTVEDFGIQGERPQNQELLDWLAVEFVSGRSPKRKRGSEAAPLAYASGSDGAWAMKYLVRLIVTSATYRQSSNVTTALAERDPENRLLARGPRFRLPSWMLRDQALAVGGLLVEKRGGKSVHPYQPPGVWEEATFGNKKYPQGHGDDLYRRSLYTFWRRIISPTMFFDTASRQTCTVKQSRTNTPLHALATLNDITYVEAARALAQRVMKAATGDRGRIEQAYRYVLARAPTVEEAKVLHAGLERLRTQYRADAKAAKELLAVGESKRDENLDAAEHAALTALCLTVLNLDEALTKE